MDDKTIGAVLSALLQHDGQVTIAQNGPDRVVTAALLPGTQLTPSAAAILRDFSSSLRMLELAGDHFPTTRIEPSELALLNNSASLVSLSAHGAYLKEEILIGALASLQNLSDLGLQGTRASEKGLKLLLPALPLLRHIRVGLAAPKAGSHRFTPAAFGADTLNLLNQFHSLTGVSLRGIAVSDEVLAGHNFLDHISFLDVGETQAGDSTGTRLAKNPRIQDLAFDHTTLTDRGLTALSSLPALQSLNVASTKIGNPGLLSLAKAVELRELDISGNIVSVDSLAALSSLASIERLSMRGLGSAAEALSKLCGSLKSLRELELSAASRLDAPKLRALARLPSLERATVAMDPKDPEAWEALSHLNATLNLTAAEPPVDTRLPSAIERYTLEGTITLKGLSHIAASRSLVRLEVTDNGGGQLLSNVEPIGFPGLRELIGEDIALTDASVQRLAKCPRLQALYISGNPISDSGLAALAASPWIHTLELRRTSITDASITVLLSLPRLHCLDVPSTMVTDHGVSQLANAPNLQSLALDGRQVTDRSAEALSHKSTLVEIYLYGPEITPAVIHKLAVLPELSELNLFEVTLGIDAANAIAACPFLRIVRVAGDFPAALPDLLKQLRPNLTVDTWPSSARLLGRTVSSNQSRAKFSPRMRGDP